MLGHGDAWFHDMRVSVLTQQVYTNIRKFKEDLGRYPAAPLCVRAARAAHPLRAGKRCSYKKLAPVPCFHTNES